MARRASFILNQIEPSWATPSTEYAVTESPAHITAMGLQGNEFIQIEVQLSGVPRGKNVEEYYWAPLSRGGCPVQLTAVNNQILELIPANYRLAVVGPYANPIVVTFDEDETRGKLADAHYTYQVPPACDTDTVVTCPTPDLPGAEPLIQIVRCDALGAVVNVLYRMVAPDNNACPQVPGGLTYVGYVDETGAFSAGPLPAGLTTCAGAACPPAVAQGVLSAWG